MKTEEYFKNIQKTTDKAFEIAEKARDQNKDPESKVDIPVATNLPEKASSLVIAAKFPELEDQGVAERIKELEDEYGKNDERVSFEIGKEIAEGRFYDFESKEKACDAGVRVGVSYMTGGITTAPLEGIGDIKVRENNDGTEYLAVYYSGPIRSAGGTASAMSVLLADYVRKNVGLDEFKPSDTVVKRYAAEVDDYYNRVTAKQYEPEREETEFIASHVPVEVTGSPTESLEVTNYKDLDRVETNQIRGGMCLVYLDGLPLKAPKIKKRIEKWGAEFGLEHWEWVKEYLELQEELHSSGGDDSDGDEETKYTPSDKYLGSLTAGRPIFGHPGRKGGFRLRYGHSRTNGLAATSFHPATMEITRRFLAIGTQMKTEYPGKATIGTPCDSIHPPIVRMENGEVKKINTREEAREVEGNLDEILFLGDILVPYGEFVENGKKLLPSPYVSEWWEKELEKTLEEREMKLGRDFSERDPTPEEAFRISEAADVPLHPKWTHHWRETTPKKFKALYDSLRNQKITENSKAKKCLEDILAQHRVENGEVKVEKKELKAIKGLLKPEEDNSELVESIEDSDEIPDVIEKISGVKIREQAPHYIGGRMGRPEKAERRTIKGKPQLLFPCGKKEGGRMRNLSASYSNTLHSEKGRVRQSIIHNRCPECGDYSLFSYCRDCGVGTEKIWFCQDCGHEHDEEPEKCSKCGEERFERYKKATINVREMMDEAMDDLDIKKVPKLLKSVRGMSAKHKHVEPIEKGLLREKHDLYVNKDGTVRYDASDLPMSHFKPEEIGVSVEKLRELGYKEDVNGEELERKDQILAMKPQDIVIPDGENTLAASDYFVRVANFIDELLEKFYGLEPYYDVEEKEDLVGSLIIGLAPHTSGGTVGRIIGFTEAKGIYSHPYWHAAKRRNCLPGDTEVKLSNGSSKKLEKIYSEAEKGKKADSSGTVEKEVDLDLVSVKDDEVAESKASKVIRTPAQDFKLEIETEAGRKLEVFPDHRVKTSEGVKTARELEENDKLISPGKINVDTKDRDKIDLLEVVEDQTVSIKGVTQQLEDLIAQAGGLKSASDKLGMSKKTLFNYKSRNSVPLNIIRDLEKITGTEVNLGDCNIAAKRDSVEISREVKVNSDFMKLLGYYLAEGYSRKSETKGEEFYQVCFSFGEEKLREKIEELIRNVFEVEPSVQDHNLVVSSRIIYEMFESMEIGAGAHSKQVPEFVKSLPEQKVADMLSAYFAGDGSTEKGRLHVQATSASRKLLQDIETLLKRFGIYARYSTWEREAGGVLIEKYGARYEGRTFTSHKIHLRSSYAKKFGKEIGFDLERKQETLEKDYAKERKPRIERKGELILEQIKNIETKKAEERFMYDLEVEETHNFLTSDNLITNNCDGDEDAILLLMDGLLNFSRQFLPDMTGARSVTKDTRLYTKINGEFRVKTAEQLIDGVLDTEGYKTREDGFEVKRDFDDNIQAVSFDEEGEVKLADVTALIRHRNDKQVFELKTSRGQISVTEDHSVFVTEGKDIEAKPVRDIEKGDCIVVPSNFDLDFDTIEDRIDLFDLLPDEECYIEVPDNELEQIKPKIEEKTTPGIIEEYGKHNIYRYKTGRRTANLKFYKTLGIVPSCKVTLKSNAEPVERYFERNEYLFRLIGYLMSEGNIESGRIYNNDSEIISDIQNCIEELTGVNKQANTDSREDREDNYWVRIPAAFRRALEELGLRPLKAENKVIPSFVLGAEKELKEEFLKAYRAGDGSIYEEKGFSKLYTKSGEMASQLSYLVRNLGFKSSTRRNGDTWEVLYSDWTEKDPYWPIWGIKESVRESLRENGLDNEDVKKWMANYRKNNRMKTTGKEKIEYLYDKGVDKLSPVAEGNIAVERVVEKNKVDYGEDYVYDLEVPNNQNFLCGPHPIFAHNTMDAPLILSTVLNPDEIDDEAWAIETVDEYPLEFYKETKDYKPPWELDTDIEIGEDVVYGDDPFCHSYTHETSSVEDGPNQSEYVTLGEMSEKTGSQLGLGRKLKAVDADATAELLLKKHFIPDIKGNLRSFSSQKMRCVDCNKKFRRVPLRSQTIAPTGKTTAECPDCQGKVLLTISEGTIKKYMQPSEEIIDEYEISPYVRQQILILKQTLQSLFGKEQRQSGLKQFT